MTRHQTRAKARWLKPLLVLMAATQFCVFRAEPPAVPSNPIRLNTVGYLPDASKVASVARPGSGFRVLSMTDGSVALEGRLKGPLANTDTDESLYFADFSELRDPGEYRLSVEGVGESPPFKIASDVYVAPYRLASRAMYLWRCGVPVRERRNGDLFTHEACHTEDAWGDHVGLGHLRIPANGGWHDAGDYNKYITNAGITVASLLWAQRMFDESISPIGLDLPESGNGVPDLLNEIRFELDWVLKMQARDGSVYHKVSTRQFGGFILPEKEKTDRFLVSTGTTATANLVAMCAMAARAFRRFDSDYSNRLTEAAEKGSAYLASHPDYLMADQTGFGTGAYASRDDDDRMWAAAEMWETTGEPRYLDDFETRARRRDPLVEADWDWGRLGNLGVFTYLLSTRQGRDPELVEKTRRSLISTADGLVANAKTHGYGRALTRYYWGANGTVARQVITLTLANRLGPDPAYLNTAQMALDHLLGRNVYGRSFVTGLGHQPPMHPHDRRSAGDDVLAPWPGYLVGGGHPTASDWHDIQPDYRTNEIAINWQAALIYAIAAFTRPER